MTVEHSIAAWWRHRWAIGLGLAIATGAAFRLIWLRDMEYKSDEVWTFTHVQSFWKTYFPWPIGMGSSAGVANAGMSLWVFIALSSFVPLDDPVALARAVALLNIVAILLLAIFALKVVEPAEREPWLWSVALVSVNHFAVLFSRKIWPPDVLAIFTLAMLWAWWYRQRWWGAFFWGLLGVMLGQIQLGGLYFCAAFASCTAIFDYRSVPWSAWLKGTIAGSVPMVPWLIVVMFNLHNLRVFGLQDVHAATGIDLQSTFVYHWIDLALGADLRYALDGSFDDFLAYPTLGDTRLHLGAALLAADVSLFAIILARLAVRTWTQPSLAIDLLFGVRTTTALALFAALWGFGLGVTTALLPMYLHYFVIAFSLPMLWLARLERAPSVSGGRSSDSGRLILGSLVLVQACLTISFLSFVHETRVIKGDYGVVYDAQSHPSK